MQKIMLTNVRVGRDPEFKTFGKTELCEFSVACDDYDFKEKGNVTTWYKVTVFSGSYLYKTAQLLKKGTMLNITGKLKLVSPDSWVVKNDDPNATPESAANYSFSNVDLIELTSGFKSKEEMNSSGGTELTEAEINNLFD